MSHSPSRLTLCVLPPNLSISVSMYIGIYIYIYPGTSRFLHTLIPPRVPSWAVLLLSLLVFQGPSLHSVRRSTSRRIDLVSHCYFIPHLPPPTHTQKKYTHTTDMYATRLQASKRVAFAYLSVAMTILLAAYQTDNHPEKRRSNVRLFWRRKRFQNIAVHIPSSPQ